MRKPPGEGLEALSASTLNAWKLGMGSAGEDIFDEWVAQESGESRADQHHLMDAVKAPPETNMADPESLRAGLEFDHEPYLDGQECQ